MGVQKRQEEQAFDAVWRLDEGVDCLRWAWESARGAALTPFLLRLHSHCFSSPFACPDSPSGSETGREGSAGGARLCPRGWATVCAFSILWTRTNRAVDLGGEPVRPGVEYAGYQRES